MLYFSFARNWAPPLISICKVCCKFLMQSIGSISFRSVPSRSAQICFCENLIIERGFPIFYWPQCARKSLKASNMNEAKTHVRVHGARFFLKSSDAFSSERFQDTTTCFFLFWSPGNENQRPPSKSLSITRAHLRNLNVNFESGFFYASLSVDCRAWTFMVSVCVCVCVCAAHNRAPNRGVQTFFECFRPHQNKSGISRDLD